MTIGFYSPLPPARSGVAEYSAALLGILKARHKLALGRDGDVNLYHLGNNQLHAPIYTRAMQRPGVVVLHDALLQHFSLGYFSREQYVEEFTYNYGEWNRAVAESLWAGRARSASDSRYYTYPMLKRIAERSLGVVVHNPAAAALVRQHCPQARVIEIPHLFVPPNLPHQAEVERFRVRLAASGPVFGVFGHLRESKRILTLLRVFSRLKNCTLLLAGEIVSADLRRAAAPFLALDGIKRIGYMNGTTYWMAAQAVDVCLNLRYPAAGETSGVSVGFMGIGKTVVMTDSQENSLYPDSACVKISCGLSEEAELESMVRWCSERRSFAIEMGYRAAAYVREFHSADRVADLYSETLTLN